MLNKIIPETILQSFHFQRHVFYLTDITRSDITESFTSDGRLRRKRKSRKIKIKFMCIYTAGPHVMCFRTTIGPRATLWSDCFRPTFLFVLEESLHLNVVASKFCVYVLLDQTKADGWGPVEDQLRTSGGPVEDQSRTSWGPVIMVHYTALLWLLNLSFKIVSWTKKTVTHIELKSRFISYCELSYTSLLTYAWEPWWRAESSQKKTTQIKKVNVAL